MSGRKEIIDRLGIDYLDALTAAYTAKQSRLGKVGVISDPDEGRIWFPEK